MIKIRVPKKGPVKIEVIGVTGEGCLDQTKGIEEALGGKVVSFEKKREFYEQEEQTYEEVYGEQTR